MRRVKDFNDAMIMSSDKVVGLFTLKDSFDEKGVVDWFENNKICNRKFRYTDWDDVVMDSRGEKFICQRTKIQKSRIDWFIKLMKVFYGTNGIDLFKLSLYECYDINYPCIIKYGEIGMIIAPVVDSDGDNPHNFKPYVEEEKKDETP